VNTLCERKKSDFLGLQDHPLDPYPQFSQDSDNFGQHFGHTTAFICGVYRPDGTSFQFWEHNLGSHVQFVDSGSQLSITGIVIQFYISSKLNASNHQYHLIQQPLITKSLATGIASKRQFFNMNGQYAFACNRSV
jgi:hypothetical protein